MLRAVITAMLLAVVPVSALAQRALESDQLPANYTLSSRPQLTSSLAAAGGGVLGRKSNGALLGIDSLPNWSSYFYDPGFDSNGFTQFTWPYTMVGRSPFGSDGDHGGRTTDIGAPIIPVNIDLRNFDGSPRFLNGKRLFLDATQYVTPVLKSPVFAKSSFTSSDQPTQITDAVQRAEFFGRADDDWHTMLRSRVLPARTMVLIRGTYQFGTNADGTLRFVLVDEGTFINALFPPTATDTTTIMGAVENSGEIKTTDFSTFLFPDTYLFEGTPANCCVLGFHSYDVEPGDAANKWREKRYVMNYASWISPGIFGGGFQDVTALSHEVAETFNDPFVNNFTPWWLAPFGLCQNNLETGDVIEGMANATFPISLNGFTYHPQNEALLPWFAGVSPSPAIDHAYSYPDTTLLTSAAVSQNPGCTPPKP